MPPPKPPKTKGEVARLPPVAPGSEKLNDATPSEVAALVVGGAPKAKRLPSISDATSETLHVSDRMWRRLGNGEEDCLFLDVRANSAETRSVTRRPLRSLSSKVHHRYDSTQQRAVPVFCFASFESASQQRPVGRLRLAKPSRRERQELRAARRGRCVSSRGVSRA